MKKIILIIITVLLVGCGYGEGSVENRGGQRIENSEITRFIDYEAQVVCYTVGGSRSIDCMPLSQTTLPKE